MRTSRRGFFGLVAGAMAWAVAPKPGLEIPIHPELSDNDAWWMKPGEFDLTVTREALEDDLAPAGFKAGDWVYWRKRDVFTR